MSKEMDALINGRKVKCPVCSQEFVRKKLGEDSYNFVYHNKRYYHPHCREAIDESHKQRTMLFDMLTEKWGEGNVNFQHISRQIKTFTEENGYTLSGIVGTVDYLLNHQRKIDMSQSKFGIGMVPYKYNEAKEYFKKLSEIQDYEYKEVEEIVVTIEAPKSKRNEGLIDLEGMF